jgi:hypothetical protein
MNTVSLIILKLKLFQEPHVVFVEEADVVDTVAQLRQERHLCSPQASQRPSPVGAAYSAHHNFLAVVVHFYVAPDGAYKII